jgi:hypothetical protein
MTTQLTPAYNPNLAVIRTMVRSAYDMQDLRIQMGNRVTASFKAKLGLRQDGMSEKELEKQEKGILDQLRVSYRRITDGVVAEHGEDIKAGKLPTERKFQGDQLISHYSELLLVDNYMATLANEQHHFKDMEKILKKIPIYTEFLTGIRGVGPAMAGIIISEIDIHKAEYPSSLWKLAGLDVVYIGKYTDGEGKEKTIRGWDVDSWFNDPANEGKQYLAEGKYPVTYEAVGRSRKDFCLVKKEYINKEGEAAQRDSITFNPFLKTKLVGVLGTSFLRAGIANVDGKKCGGASRLELAKEEGFNPKDYPEMEEDQAVIVYLRAKGHDVVVEPSKYAVMYADYKNRLNNNPKHRDKTALHKHNMAMRFMVKRFLVDLYNAWRRLEGLVVAPEYSEGVLGKVHGQAKEAGWQHPRFSL